MNGHPDGANGTLRVLTTAVLVMAMLRAWITAAPAQNLPLNPPLPPRPGTVSAPATPPNDPDAPPPYEPLLERLAERLGTLALLRDLCADGDAAAFRSRMASLLDAEAPTASRRERLAGAFNAGYRGYAASYRSCTPSARLVIARSLAEAERLTRDLTGRYGAM